MRRWRAALLGLVLAAVYPAAAQGAGPLVKAVFFYSPECAHCHKVISEDMPGISQQFGDRLLVVYVDVSSPQGADYFNDVMDHYGIAEDQRGVPAVVVDNQLLVGEIDIPEKLPAITTAALEGNGLDWPSFAGLRELGAQAELLATQEARTPQPTSQAGATTPEAMGPEAASTGETQGTTAEASSQPSAPPVSAEATPQASAEPVGAEAAISTTQALSEGLGSMASMRPEGTNTVANMTLGERLARDPLGFAIAIAVLIALVISAVFVGVSWFRDGLSSHPVAGWRTWVVPSLAVIGFGVAVYLAYVEIAHVETFCGPVGDCNTVQQSPFATLFGVLPVGLLGAVGYLVVLGLWALQRFAPADFARRLDFLLPSVTMFGVLFSIYLTFLEVFVIGAVCMWCVTSATIMGLVLWAIYRGWATPAVAGAPAESSRPARASA